MKIGIVGASSAGIYASILIKKAHPDYKVVLFDKNEKVGRKLLATGNGHCNLLNLSATALSYHQKDFLAPLFEKHPVSELRAILEELGVPLKCIGALAYPLSYSADAFVEHLKELMFDAGVKIQTSSKVLGYENTTLITDKGSETFDKLIFATGGMSQKNLGSDGALFEVFAKHGRTIVEPKPGLCPIKTKEKTKDVSGVRHEANVTLLNKNRVLFEEYGEVIFKDDGLSGIVVFNAESFLIHNNISSCEIELDLFPEFNESQLSEIIAKTNDLKSILPIKLAKYLENRKPQNAQMSHFLKHVPFVFNGTYGFDQSQVTIGGIALTGIRSDLSFQNEKDVHFVGEILDIDGPCGGYNLTWCLLSALVVAESI